MLRLLSYITLPLLLFLTLCAVDSSAQITFRKTYGRNSEDHARSMVQTADQGFVVVGTTAGDGNGDTDIYLFKTNSIGELEWSTTIGGNEIDWGYDIIQTYDGGFAIAGYTSSYNAQGYDFLLVKTDSLGAQEWLITAGSEEWEFAYALLQDRDSNIVVVGETNNTDDGSTDMFVAKFSQFGDSIWERTFGGDATDVARDIDLLHDGNYIVGGYSDSYSESEDFLIYKLDTLGAINWVKTFGSDSTDQLFGLKVTADSGLFIAGGSARDITGELDFHAELLDKDYVSLWDFTVGGPNDDIWMDCDQVFNGDLCVTGYTESASGEYNIYFQRLTINGGNLLFSPYGGTEDDQGFKIISVSDGSFAMTGSMESFGSGYSDAFILKVKSNGTSDSINFTPVLDTIGLTTKIELKGATDHLIMFPNPSTGLVNLMNLNIRGILEITDIRGNLIHRQSLLPRDQVLDLAALNFAQGIYSVRILNAAHPSERMYQGKIIYVLNR